MKYIILSICYLFLMAILYLCCSVYSQTFLPFKWLETSRSGFSVASVGFALLFLFGIGIIYGVESEKKNKDV